MKRDPKPAAERKEALIKRLRALDERFSGRDCGQAPERDTYTAAIDVRGAGSRTGGGVSSGQPMRSA